MSRFIKVLSAASLTAIVLSACSPQPESPQAGQSSSTASTSVAATTPPAAPTPSIPPPITLPGERGGSTPATSTWTTFQTADHTMAFDLPPAWNVKDPAGELAEGGGAFAEVRNQDGKVMATLRTNMAIGSSCTQKYPYEVLDTADLPELARDNVVPQFVFETRGNAGTPGPPGVQAAGYGITSGPAPTGPTACPILHFFRWPPNSAMFGAFYDPANNTTPGDPSLPYQELAMKYRETAEYADIKQMITSLRPARGGGY